MADRGTQTGGSSGGRGGGIPLGAGSQTIKGGLLVLAAVVLGIVLLQVVDPGKSGPVAQRPTTTTSPAVTTTTTKKPGKTTPTTKAGSTAAKKPAQIKLLVLNAGAPTGSAKSVSTTLKGKGYTNQGTPQNDPNHHSVSEVLCKAGFTREGKTLATLLGKGTTHATIGNPAPPGSAGYDCVVLVGAQGVK
jgi:LytR cell envelope-related transcriptional attenuator